jgi:hypothetical protein
MRIRNDKFLSRILLCAFAGGIKIGFSYKRRILICFRFEAPPAGGVFLSKLWAEPMSINKAYIQTRPFFF